MIISSLSRSGAKAITWRAIATTTTMTLVYIFTGKADLSLEIGLLDVLIKLAFYVLHERIWERVGYGRNVRAPQGLTAALNWLANIENH
jgi:adenylylsulfate kinase